ncbi:MAG: glycerate kinase [Chloroflexi bacterium]|nr:glycerate kinase [Chloroflexota bacterium]
MATGVDAGGQTRKHATQIFQAALASADAHAAVFRNLAFDGASLTIGKVSAPLASHARVVVIGAGKASARMGLAVEEMLGSRINGGLISVKDGHGVSTRFIQVREAGHPLPDARSLANGRAILQSLNGLTAHDVVLCLISGGGSALMEVLADGLTLSNVRAVTDTVMRAGADISDLNCVRKHLSLLKGGQLARAAQPAAIFSLILSDVVGNDLSAIASGPTCPDPTTFADALQVISRCDHGGIPAMKPVIGHLERGARGELSETPKPDEPFWNNVRNLIIGSNEIAIEAAAREARALGYTTEIATLAMQGEAREVGRTLAELACRRRAEGAHQLCLLAGGETTVTVRGLGIGGRNQELTLASALALDGTNDVTLLSAATDGGDGSSDAAGAVVNGATIRRGSSIGLDAQVMLEQNDSHHFFRALGDQVITGPTLTNVNDVVMILIE